MAKSPRAALQRQAAIAAVARAIKSWLTRRCRRRSSSGPCGSCEQIGSAWLGGITAIFLGVMTFLIYAMDHPLQGAVSVGDEPFQSVFDLVMKWDEPS
jgi:hypothetical protein